MVKVLLCLLLPLSVNRELIAQVSLYHIDGTDIYPRYVSALFLTIAPDARSSGMADVGIASSPDINSQHWNSAKYAFIERKGGISLSYAPWLRNSMNTHYFRSMHLGYLSGYYSIKNKNFLSGSFRYFTWGITQPSQIGIWDPYDRYEFAADIGYSRLFTDHLSGGIVLRYIHSDILKAGATADGHDPAPGRSVAGDIGLYYHEEVDIGGKTVNWALGLNISNIGSPISYYEEKDHKIPIPTNLGLGSRFTFNINQNNSLSFHLDINKLLVPTMPVYGVDTVTDELIILYGKELPKSAFNGMVQSFSDAPGVVKSDGTRSVVLEEFYEIRYNFGAVYWHKNKYAVRAGYFHEHASKGYRQYFTFGAGVKVSFLSFDFSYLVPLVGKDSPLANTFRISLIAEFG